LGRETLDDSAAHSLSHPALVGDVIYVRGINSISAWLIADDE